MNKYDMGGFRSYISMMLPGYESFLDEEQIDNLHKLYIEWEKHDRIAINCLHKHLSSTARVDYANDFEKQMDIAARHGSALHKAIENIKIVYGLNNQETISSEKTII